MVLFCCLGVELILQVSHQAAGLLGPNEAAFAAAQRNSWWSATLHVLVAFVAVYLLARRRTHVEPLVKALSSDPSPDRHQLEALADQQRLNEARAHAEAERDAHAAMLN